ncbi:MAG: hypothetical protein IJ309_04960 [Clostridia bacterium]|nr:hypothetical protein [Clostridia bacterium]
MKKLITVLSILLALCLCACSTPVPPVESGGTSSLNGGLADDSQDGIEALGNPLNVAFANPIEAEETYDELSLENREYIGNAFPKIGSYYQVLDTYEKIKENIANVTQEELNLINLSKNYLVILREAYTSYSGVDRAGEYGFRELSLSENGASITHHWHELKKVFVPGLGPQEPQHYKYYWHYLIVPRGEDGISDKFALEGSIDIKNSSVLTDEHSDSFSYYNTMKCVTGLVNNTAILVKGKAGINEINSRYPQAQLPSYPPEGEGGYNLMMYVEESIAELPTYTFANVTVSGNNVYLSVSYCKEWKKGGSKLFFISLPQDKMQNVDLKNAQVHIIVTEIITAREIISAATSE